MHKVYLLGSMLFLAACGVSKFKLTDPRVNVLNPCTVTSGTGVTNVDCGAYNQFVFNHSPLTAADLTNEGAAVLEPCDGSVESSDEVIIILPDNTVLAFNQVNEVSLLSPNVRYIFKQGCTAKFILDSNGYVVF